MAQPRGAEGATESGKLVRQSISREARHKRWPSRDDEDVPTPTLAKIEAEEKKTRTNAISVGTSPDEASPVRTTKKEPQVRLAERWQATVPSLDQMSCGGR